MPNLHKKSNCCGAKIIRFGGKRRQCTHCKKTWSVHPAKRGRKPLRKQCHYLKNVFEHGFKVKQLSVYSDLTVDTLYKRFNKSLEEIAQAERNIEINGSKLILVIDAEWHFFQGQLWTLYFLAIKSTNSTTVTILDPVLKQGRENAQTWNEIFSELPVSIKKRIVVLVSDGIRGIENIAKNRGWIIQRCHFHILSKLQNMRGKRVSTPGGAIREEVYASIKILLSETSPRRINILCRRLEYLTQEKHCPKRMRMIIRDFLRKMPEFRSYLSYPDLKIPTTVNVMESLNSFVREKAKTTNTPKSWHKWATACARIKSKFICK